MDHRALRWLAVAAGALALALPGRATPAECPGYESRPPQTRDGSGRVYLGREIAPVMGHLGAAWLERPEREAEEEPSILIRELGLKAGDTVADIGAGTGYFSFRIAPLIGNGKVLVMTYWITKKGMAKHEAELNKIFESVKKIKG